MASAAARSRARSASSACSTAARASSRSALNRSSWASTFSSSELSETDSSSSPDSWASSRLEKEPRFRPGASVTSPVRAPCLCHSELRDSASGDASESLANDGSMSSSPSTSMPILMARSSTEGRSWLRIFDLTSRNSFVMTCRRLASLLYSSSTLSLSWSTPFRRSSSDLRTWSWSCVAERSCWRSASCLACNSSSLTLQESRRLVARRTSRSCTSWGVHGSCVATVSAEASSLKLMRFFFFFFFTGTTTGGGLAARRPFFEGSSLGGDGGSSSTGGFSNSSKAADARRKAPFFFASTVG